MSIQVNVDPRVELMSIIFHLAGNPEYAKGMVGSYTRDVDGHFLPFKDHSVVQLARKLREKQCVMYSAPMNLAVHVTDAFALKEKVPFKPHPKGLEKRWHSDDAREFLQEARHFVKQTRFKEFVQAHQRLYDQATARMTATMTRHGHIEWFDSFFGERPGASFHLFLGMLNGPCCYGASLLSDKKAELYCFLGVWECDTKGIPRFPRNVLPTVVHEFNHSYVTPLVDKYAADFEKFGKKTFSRIEQAMMQQGYGSWQMMVEESIVRACVVRYRQANEGNLAAKSETHQQHAREFVWVGELSRLLEEYEKQRGKYPTFSTFMPGIVRFFNEYASEADAGQHQSGADA